MRKLLVFTACVGLSGSLFAQTWTVDKAHAKVGFSVTHLMLSEVDGNFKTFDAKIAASKPDLSDAVFDMTADVNSIDTGNDQRDGDLKSEKYFDAAKYPTLSFKSKSFQKLEDKKYKIAGDLTMHGVTKPITLDAVMNGPVTNESPRGKTEKVGFRVTGTLKRSDFNLGSAPAAVIGDEINLRVNGEFAKQ